MNEPSREDDLAEQMAYFQWRTIELELEVGRSNATIRKLTEGIEAHRASWAGYDNWRGDNARLHALLETASQ